MENNNIPKATHFGKISIAGKDLSCAVLEDGTRILTQTAIFQAFDRPRKGKSLMDPRNANVPSFVDANNLKPFVDKAFSDGTQFSVSYEGNMKRKLSGYKADILPTICNVYLEARREGVLADNQQQLATISEILLASFAKVGITALIDEATGYQYEREQDELQKILSMYIAEEFLPWTKRFPNEFYRHIFRIYGWEYNPMTPKRPGYIGKLTNELIYDQLPPGVAEKLKETTPKSKSGNYTKRFFQGLTPDIGNPHLEKLLVKAMTVLELSDNPAQLKENCKRAYEKTVEVEEE